MSKDTKEIHNFIRDIEERDGVRRKIIVLVIKDSNDVQLIANTEQLLAHRCIEKFYNNVSKDIINAQ